MQFHLQNPFTAVPRLMFDCITRRRFVHIRDWKSSGSFWKSAYYCPKWEIKLQSKIHYNQLLPKSFTAKRQQQVKMSPCLQWPDWGHQRQEELTGPWEWWPQSRSTCIVAPHLPYKGWPHSTQNSRFIIRPKVILHCIIISSTYYKQEITFMCCISNLSIQGKYIF